MIDHTNIEQLPTPADQGSYRYCHTKPEVPRQLAESINPLRASFIRRAEKKWANGTVLHYYFFDQDSDGREVITSSGERVWSSWVGTEAERIMVRQAFRIWKSVGLGLKFVETKSREEAEIRIGFMKGDGSWSFIGRDILNQGVNERTMNFGWNIATRGEVDTAVHEIGHTLGFYHEHQNPNAGIVWDEEAVYQAMARPPNRWSRQKTYHDILRKLDPGLSEGSEWDPDSIMHYPFGPRLIKEPEQYWKAGLVPAPGLSERDKAWARSFYPPLDDSDLPILEPYRSVPLQLLPGSQANFRIAPNASRTYHLQTFGESDTVMVLFEATDSGPRYLTADDDGGQDTNSRLVVKLHSEREYILRVRLYYAAGTGETAVMLW